MRLSHSLIAAAFSAVLCLLPLATSAADETPQRGGTLTATWGGLEPQALFVPAGGGSSPFFTSTKVLERLLRLEGDLSFTPLLAESVKAAPDFKSFTVKLRAGVKFHDGHAFSAEDVAWNATEYWKPISIGVALKALKSADAIDAQNVVFKLDAPISEFAFKSILASGLVLPKHLYAGKDILTNPLNNTPVGTGPFKVKAWVRGSHVEYVRNELYWNPKEPYLDKLIIRWWRDPASRAAALESGALDIATFNPVPVPDLARLVATGQFVVDKGGYASAAWVSTIEFNQRRDNVNKREVRQALLQAIDRKFIADTVYYKQARPAISPFSSANTLFHNPDVPQYPFDPVKAGKALDAAGYPVKDGWRFTVNLVSAGWFEENFKIGQYVKQALEDVKVKVNLQIPDRPTSIKRIYGDYDFDIALSNNSASIEPVPTLTQFYTTDGIIKGAAFRNATGYSNPQLDQLVFRLSTETALAKRKQIAHEFARIVNTDVPLVPLVEIEAYTVAHKKVHGHSTSANFMGEGWGNVWIAR
jgi:peptide/nickel transport system substrate-binding protein